MPIICKRLQLETFVSSTCGLITTNTTGRVFLLSYDDCADIILVCAVNIPRLRRYNVEKYTLFQPNHMRYFNVDKTFACYLGPHRQFSGQQGLNAREIYTFI